MANPDLSPKDLEAQELHVFSGSDMTLPPIDGKVQVLFEEPHNTLKDSMSSTFGLHQDDKVICPSAVAMATSVEFVVQLIEYHVREYRRNRGTLGASLGTLLKYAIHDHTGF